MHGSEDTRPASFIRREANFPPSKPARIVMEKLSIAEATRRVIWTRPSMIDALKQGVINYKALAENIYDEVKVLLQKKDSELIALDSIQTALIRYAEDLKKEK